VGNGKHIDCRKGKKTNQSLQEMFSSKDDVTKAELKWTLAMADNNIPFKIF